MSALPLSLPASLSPASGPVLVALSGGADSVSLLLAMCDLGYSVQALHCNFELRGTASDGDEAFCRRLCRAHDIPLHVKHFRTRSYAARHHISIEMAARDLRYEWFAQQAAALGAQALCVAHHRDDQIETLFLNLIRGTGIHGLTGMSLQSHLPLAAASGLTVPLLRPLLNISRADIESWLTQRGQEWVTDATNLDPDAALRNKLRLRLLPLMEEMNPRFRDNLAQTITRLADAESLYQQALETNLATILGTTDQPLETTISVAALMASPAPRTILHEILHPCGFSASQITDIFATIDGTPGHLWSSPQGWRLLRDRSRLILQAPATAAMPSSDSDERVVSPAVAKNLHGRPLPLDGFYEGPQGLRILIRRHIIDPATFEIPREARTACFDLEKLTLPLTLRTPREGDIFQPFGMSGTRLLSDFLTDRKLTLFEKERQPLILSGDNIVWVAGLRTAAGYEVTPQTRIVIILTLL